MDRGLCSYFANDLCALAYRDSGPLDAPTLILLHGFTGSSEVWGRNIPAFQESYRVIAPDLRGHGSSQKSRNGHHVARLAMDLKELIDGFNLAKTPIKVIAGSLGCAIIWCYAELFTAADFCHVVFVDQSPLQNYTSDGEWGPDYGNRSCNSAAALAHMQATLKYDPDDVYNGTISLCLAYLSHPKEDDNVSEATMASDREFFLSIAQEGDAEWFGKLMADHTSLDWRESIPCTFRHRSIGGVPPTRVLVIASNRSGCFPPAGPLHVVDLINSGGELDQLDMLIDKDDPVAVGVTIDWGGHWCYYEDPTKFNELVLDFFKLPVFQKTPSDKEDGS